MSKQRQHFVSSLSINTIIATMIVQAVLLACVLNPASGQSQFNYRWDAKTFWGSSTSQNVMLKNDAIVLDDQQLYQDDSPGFGFDSDPDAVEILQKDIVLRKIFTIDRLPVDHAYIVAMLYPENPPAPNNGRHVIFTINGHTVKYKVDHFWTQAKIPGSFLKKGKNIVTLTTSEPDTKFRTWIALERNYKIGGSPKKPWISNSSRSNDGGLTWSSQGIGINGNAQGEYVIRLKTISYDSSGVIESHIIDVASDSANDIITSPATVEGISIRPSVHNPKRTSIKIDIRTGSTREPDSLHWSPWMSADRPLVRDNIKGRFVQLRATLMSANPEVTPSFHSLNITATVRFDSSSSINDFHVISSRQYPRIRSSFSFFYENPHQNRLQKLRERFNFDSLVNGANTEFEKILALKHWVAQQWTWHLLRPDQDIIEWDAASILTPDSTGKIEGGFCLHYAIVMMQVLQSFGLHARIVSADYSIWSGHEVCEVWSNDYGKWIMLDANFDTYFADKRTGIPLNVLELHELFVREFYPTSMIDRDDWSREKLVHMANEKAKNLPIIGMTGGGANKNTLREYDWWNPLVEQIPYCGGYGPLTMGFVRLVPRSDFLSRPTPIPINHGRTHWGWTGYYNWYDDHTPRTQEHELFTDRKNDLYWNINQVGFHVEALPHGHLRFEFETNTPDFEGYEVIHNGRQSLVRNNTFIIASAHGLNRFEVRTTDSMGNKGTVSYLEYIYLPHQEQSIPK